MRALTALALLWLPAGRAGAAETPAPRTADQSKAIDSLCQKAKRGELSPAALLEEETRSPGLLPERVAQAVYSYQLCEAISGGAQSCAALRPFEQKRGLERRCRMLSASALMTRAALKGGDAVAPCRPLAELWQVAAPKRDAFCAAYARGIASGGLACGDYLSKELITREQLPECERGAVFLKGDPDACAKEAAKPVKQGQRDPSAWVQGCRLTAQIVAAVRDGRKDVCARAPLCEALNSGESACAGLRREALLAFQRDAADGRACGDEKTPAETPEVKARREREQADWVKRRTDDDAKRKADQVSKFQKSQVQRLAARDKKARDEEAAKKKQDGALMETRSQRQYRDNEPMSGPSANPPPGAGQNGPPKVPPGAKPSDAKPESAQ